MDSKQRYCICRSTDAKSFMIACDECEEWFHGKCIKVTPDAASRIKRYYCITCQQKNPDLKIKYKKPKDKSQKSTTSKEPAARKKTEPPRVKSPLPDGACGECNRCRRDDDCGVCEACKAKQRCKHRLCKKLEQEKNSKTEEPSPQPPPPPPKKRRAQAKPRKPAKAKPSQPQKPKRQYIRRKQSENPTVGKKEAESAAARQCLGPFCVQPARRESKYCSDDCGMKLAAMRLVEIMPSRVAQWQSSPCVAEQRNREQLEEIGRKMFEAKRYLEELDEKRRALDRIVELGKKEKVKEEESEEEGSNSEEEDEEEDMELSVYCVTCGHEVKQRNAIKHMEKCFIKAERDMSFAGTFQSQIGGDTICDHYNASSKTYCKRLKAICPEHSKEPKIADDEICGCPLTKQLFTETADLCKNAKKHCAEHFKWEKLRRAEIDADKVRQWMKIETLVEKERLIRAAMSNRAGVLGLLLHQTVDHQALQSHHKPHTPAKADAKMAAAKMAAPSADASRNLAAAIGDGQPAAKTEPMAVDAPARGDSSPPVDSKDVIVDHDYSQQRAQPAPSKEHDYC